ncbi:MAG: aspartate--tRNA(Asn) ligase [Candidatus Paceibacterota bacterium]|jgi:aspartyl-tRNA synthetase
MKRTLINQLPFMTPIPGGEVLIKGFVEAVRNQKRMVFLTVRDHTGLVQVVHDKREGDVSLTLVLESVTQGSAVEVIGPLVVDAQVKLGGVEIPVRAFHVVSAAETPLPIDSESSLEKQLDWRYLSLRRPENLLIFKVQTLLEQAMREFWKSNGFLEIHSPKLTPAATESGSELFTVPYFGKQACLAQSPQFYKQMAMAAGFDRIFEIGPVFRANPSFTTRHDTEFTSVDMEVSWIDSHEELMRLEEAWLLYAISRVAGEYGLEIEAVFGVKVAVPTVPFPRISLEEARGILATQGHFISHKEDLDPEGERMLARHILETTGNEFVFVTDYPVSVRPFYHMRKEGDPETTKSFDLLWKGLEVTTGAQREHRHEILTRQAEEKGIDLDSIRDYLNFFRFGCPPHGGMGVGLTRLLMILLGRSSVREVTYLYRGPNRLTP